MAQKVITGITGTQTTATWTAPAQRTTILDTTNPRFPRNLVLSGNGVALVRGTASVGIPKADLIAACVAYDPTLTWAPIIVSGPNSPVVVHPAPTSFKITASSEIAITYQWQISTNGGSSWANVANGGVPGYSNVTAATMNIFATSTGMNTYKYRCIATNAAGSTTSGAGTLTVT